MARQIKVEILADARRLNQAFDSVDKRVRTFGGGLKSMAGVVAGSFAAMGVGKFIADSVKGFQDHQKLVAQTTTVIKSTGGAAQVSAGQVSRLADALERKTTVDGDVIQSGANMLLTFTNVRNEVGKGNDIFNRATSTVLDMSVALGQDTKSSAIQLGKALNDPIKGVGALSRVGVTFTAQQKEQIKTLVEHGNVLGAQKIILGELNKEFGGSAASQATAWGKLVVIYHQVQDAIGAALLPMFNKLVDWMAGKLPAAISTAERVFGRLSQAVRGTFDLLVRGDFTRAFAKAFHVAEDDAVVDRLFRIREAVTKLWAALRAGGLAGLQAEIGRLFGPDVAARFNNIVTTARNLAAAFKGATPAVGGLGAGFSRTSIILNALLPVFDRLSGVLKAHPGIVQGAVLAYAGFRPVSTVLSGVKAGVEGVVGVGKGFIAVSKGIRAAIVGETLAENASTVAKVANKVATIAVTVASKAWAAGQWLVNAALSANPIGLVIALIAALAAGVIYAYRHSATFRKIVDGAFRAIAAAGKWMWENVLKPAFAAIGRAFNAVGTAAQGLYNNVLKPYFRFITNAWLAVVSALVHGAADAFGWVPGVGPKLRSAAKRFDEFRAGVNKAMDGIHGKTVDVRANASFKVPAGFSVHDIVGRATGGPVFGQGGPTSDSIPAWLSNGEHVISAREVRGAGGHQAIEQMRTQWRGAPPGFANGGAVVNPVTTGLNQFRSGAAGYNQTLTAIAQGMGRTLRAGMLRLFESFGGGPEAAAIKAFIRSVDKLPYRWGGVGPGSYDCSGLVGEVWNRITGNKSYVRRWTTGVFPGQLGFKKLKGQQYNPDTGGFNIIRPDGKRHAFTIGVGDGHTVGQFMGLGFEAANRRAGIRVGSAARSVNSFRTVAYLPLADRKYLMGGAGAAGGRGGLSAAEAWIIQRESGGRTTADNPTSSAFGLGQLLLANRQRYARRLGVSPSTTNYASQLSMMRMYIAERYGSAERAKAFWQAHGWYRSGGAVRGGVQGGVHGATFDQGGWLKPGLTMAYNGTGRPERVLPPGGGAVTLERGAVQLNVYGSAGQSEERLAALVDARLQASLGAVLGSVRARRAR